MKAKANQTVAQAKSTKAQESAQAPVSSNESRGREHENAGRPARKKFSRGGQLDAPVREGYQRYWAINNPGEIEDLEERWWTKVCAVNGAPITKPAGNGKMHYLLEIPKEYYDEDRAEQQRLIDETMRGVTNVNRNQGEYAPNIDGQRRDDGLYVDDGYAKAAERHRQNQG